MTSDLTRTVVEDGEAPSPPKPLEEPRLGYYCLNCKERCHSWQRFCGAACTAIYEAAAK